MKNTLATVLAITSQSLRTADTLEQGRLAVESRLMALGRAHDLLLQANWSSAKLTDVIRAAIEPFDGREVRRFAVQETPIEIGAGAVLPLTMSLNELCTNAVKYGALSNSTGRIEIASSIDEKAQRIKLIWTESGGPPVREPTRRSFGTRLINRLAEQLHGEVRMKYQPRDWYTKSTFRWPPCKRGPAEAGQDPSNLELGFLNTGRAGCVRGARTIKHRGTGRAEFSLVLNEAKHHAPLVGSGMHAKPHRIRRAGIDIRLGVGECGQRGRDRQHDSNSAQFAMMFRSFAPRSGNSRNGNLFRITTVDDASI